MSFTSIWGVQPQHQRQPLSFTAAWCLLNPRAVFLVHNLEGFVVCQACLNVRALQIFKCFCHTHRALAELLCLKPLLGRCGRGLTFWPLWVLSACSEVWAQPCYEVSVHTWAKIFPASDVWVFRTSQFVHSGICNCKTNPPASHRVLKHKCFLVSRTKIHKYTNKKK